MLKHTLQYQYHTIYIGWYMKMGIQFYIVPQPNDLSLQKLFS